MPNTRQGMVIAVIVLLHVGFFYALQAGLMRSASRFVQEEVFARLILPDPPASCRTLSAGRHKTAIHPLAPRARRSPRRCNPARPSR